MSWDPHEFEFHSTKEKLKASVTSTYVRLIQKLRFSHVNPFFSLWLPC